MVLGRLTFVRACVCERWVGYISAVGGYILDYLKNNNPLKHSVTGTDPNCYLRHFLMARKTTTGKIQHVQTFSEKA